MRNTSNGGKWPKVRKFLNDIHLWGGLISGIVVFVVCLTGTIYTYNTELREAALSEYYRVDAVGDKQDPDLLLAAVGPHVQGKIVGIKLPHEEGRSAFVLYHKPAKDGEAAPGQSGGRGRGPRANHLAINPYTGEVIGDPAAIQTKTAAFMQKVFGLHRWLLLNEVEQPIIQGVENRKLGSWITGTATLLFLLGLLTGMVIWFPNKIRAWKNGLNIRWKANWKRVNHDLHNTLGFYSFIFLFFMSVTGPFWSFDWYRAGWQKTWGTYQDPNAPKMDKPKPISDYRVGQAPISIAQTLAVVNDILPYAGDVTINFASDSVGTINVSKNRIGFFAPAAGDRLVLDQYSGTLLEKDIFREKPFNERAAASVKALHIGNVYGPFTKLLYFLACLIATSLPVTGVLIWVNKMKKKKPVRRTPLREKALHTSTVH